MVHCFCHCMSLHVYLGDFFLFLIAVWPLVWDRNGPLAFCLLYFDCGVIA